MRRFLLLVLLVLVAGIGYWAWSTEPWAAQSDEPAYRTTRVERGTIMASVNATGTINPLSTVIVGSQLSGQVIEILSDYNDRVRANQIMARLNTDQIRARFDAAQADLLQSRAQVMMQEAQVEKNRSDALRAQATLADVQAQVRRAEAQLTDAETTFGRTQELQRRSIATDVQLQAARTALATARATLDSTRAQIRSAEAQIGSLAADAKVIEAQLASARAAVQQREAMIRNIEVDLRNAEIRSPVDGVVVQRNIELGQTVAASLQAPILFLVAEDLRTMRIFANVDETDVGRVRTGQTVSFTVNAFPGRTFEGRVDQVRLGSQTVQNVVIYTAVIVLENPDNVLLPGMTANLRILTERRENVLRISNAALRWRPPAEPAAAAPTNPFAPPTMGFGGGPPGAGGPPGGQRPPGAGGPGGGGPGQAAQAMQQQITEFVEAMKRELSLDANQIRDVEAAFAEQRRNARAQFSPDMTPDQRRQAFQRLREETNQRIAALLRAEQREGFDRLRARFAEGRQATGGTIARVYVVGHEGRPQAVRVRIGSSDGTTTELLDPGSLAEGGEVIVGAAPRSAATQRNRFWIF